MKNGIFLTTGAAAPHCQASPAALKNTRFLEHVGVPMLTKPRTLDDIHRVTQRVLQGP